MEGSAGFVSVAGWSLRKVRGLAAKNPLSVQHGRGGRRVVQSLQTPFGEGPPPLEEYFNTKRKMDSIGVKGGTVKIGTGRGLLKDTDGDLEKAFETAIGRGMETLACDPQLVHVTMTTDIDASALRKLVMQRIPAGTPFFGRTIAKDGAEGVLEVMLLSAENTQGYKVSVSMASSDNAGGLAAATEAAQKLNGALPQEDCQFLIFSSAAGPTEESLRQGLATVYPQAVAYGGVASGLAEDSCKWVLFSEEGIERESSETKSFTVMALPGQLAFMLSAVVKNWAQPKLQQPLAYLTPKYGDDSVLDLLTAIRFNDWDKFIYLIEEDNVDVNVRWTHKQNQTPILAAAGRGRVEMVEYLLKKGADVNIRNASGFTAIMYTDLLQNEEASALPNDRLSRQRDILLDAGATPEPFVQVPAQ